MTGLAPTQENFIIDHYITDTRGDTRNDGTHAVDMILALYEAFGDQLKDVLRALVHDMALSAADHDRLLDAGLLGISKVPRKIGNVLSAAYLGEIEFTASDGTKHMIDATSAGRQIERKTRSQTFAWVRPASMAPATRYSQTLPLSLGVAGLI